MVDVLDPHEIFRQAMCFKAADGYMRVAKPDELSFALINPAIVCSAFASELFFKCLIVLENGKIKRLHSLDELFLALNPPTQKRVSEIWHDISTTMMKNLPPNFSLTPDGQPVKNDLLFILEACGDAFQGVRYIYENIENRSFILTHLPEVLMRVILESRPDWAPKKLAL